MNIENLRQARKNSGLTQKEVADKLGIGQSTYKNYEGGLREPNGNTTVLLANLFHVTTDYLLGRDAGELGPVEQLAGQFNMTALEQKILDNYLSLPEEMRQDLMEFLRKSVQEVQKEATQTENID